MTHLSVSTVFFKCHISLNIISVHLCELLLQDKYGQKYIPLGMWFGAVFHAWVIQLIFFQLREILMSVPWYFSSGVPHLFAPPTGFKLTVSLQTGTWGGGWCNYIILSLPANWSVFGFTCMFTNHVSLVWWWSQFVSSLHKNKPWYRVDTERHKNKWECLRKRVGKHTDKTNT